MLVADLKSRMGRRADKLRCWTLHYVCQVHISDGLLDRLSVQIHRYGWELAVDRSRRWYSQFEGRFRSARTISTFCNSQQQQRSNALLWHSPRLFLCYSAKRRRLEPYHDANRGISHSNNLSWTSQWMDCNKLWQSPSAERGTCE